MNCAFTDDSSSMSCLEMEFLRNEFLDVPALLLALVPPLKAVPFDFWSSSKSRQSFPPVERRRQSSSTPFSFPSPLVLVFFPRTRFHLPCAQYVHFKSPQPPSAQNAACSGGPFRGLFSICLSSIPFLPYLMDILSHFSFCAANPPKVELSP